MKNSLYLSDGIYVEPMNYINTLHIILWYKDMYAPSAVSLRIIMKKDDQYVEFIDKTNKTIDTRWIRDWETSLDCNKIYLIDEILKLIKNHNEKGTK